MRNSGILMAVGLALCATFTVSADPLKVLMLSGSLEYESDDSLGKFTDWMQKHYRDVEMEIIQAVGADRLDGTEKLETCDVALFFTRRLTITGEALERVKKYCMSGKPIVGVRTASHGFQNWLEFDKEILGGNYNSHHGKERTTKAVIEAAGKAHPIFDGIAFGEIRSRGSLYKTGPLAADCVTLMTGSIPGAPPEPVAWTREVNGGRVFYTSIGAQTDFESATYCTMLAQALHWAAGREPMRRDQADSSIHKVGDDLNMELHVPVRTRTESAQGSGKWEERITQRDLASGETAIIICDMWDKHWCDGATARVDLIAPRINEVIKAARARGVLIVHAPSDTMFHYADWPQRLRAKNANTAEKPKPLDLTDPPLPIDDSDGGCDTDNTPQYSAWTRQHAAIEIDAADVISDNGDEIFNVFRAEGIRNVILMGVHTNMCVLGRSFAIRQMARWGFNVTLVRDLTDTMYDPKDPPQVPHDQGTELVVQHIEKYWGPTMTSGDLVDALK